MRSEQRSLQSFCHVVTNELFGWMVNNSDAPILDSISYVKVSDIDVPSSFGTGTLSVIFKLYGTSVVLLNDGFFS